MKKKIQNIRRSGKGRQADSGKETGAGDSRTDTTESPLDETTLHYIQMVTSLIEDRPVALDEIREMMNEILRQHSMGKRKKVYYPDKYPRGKPK